MTPGAERQAVVCPGKPRGVGKQFFQGGMGVGKVRKGVDKAASELPSDTEEVRR